MTALRALFMVAGLFLLSSSVPTARAALLPSMKESRARSPSLPSVAFHQEGVEGVINEASETVDGISAATGLSRAAIIGIVAGVAGLILLLIIALCCCCCCR
eukprot:GFKZ01004607.1.p1 GENE.GFKZ01004607.1~~GFKZ01004607.1.p1  ORF type:complete len:102 (+),score=6.55 GFKZ01004607.1:244-549(+)